MRQYSIVNLSIRIAATIILLVGTLSMDIAETRAQPNVVVMMADDIGLGDLSYYHRLHSDQPPSVITPNLDGLIESGIGDSNWDPALAGPMLAKKAVAYIETQTTAYPNEPFYLYYCSQAVHIPHTPTTELDGVKVASATLGTHGDMILELDTQVGMLQKALRKASVYDNTLFVFTSDNGGLNHDAAMREAGHNSSFVLTGKKGSYFEGGHRVPFIAVWPGKIEANTESHETIVTHDMVATVSALAGQPLHRTVLDSANLLPYFSGTATKKAHKYLLHRGGKGPTYALREGDWKLILETDPNWQTDKDKNVDFGPLTPVGLYNLKEHLSEDETFNLIKNPQHAVRVESMHATYLRLRKTQDPTVAN